jgi:ribonuclease HII
LLLPRLLENYTIQVGVDEAGRGCLAGPVVAAAVILPKNYSNKELNDSKKLNLSQRNKLRAELLSNSKIKYGIGVVSHEEIDQINILQATFLAMHRAIDQLNVKKIDILLIDGNRFKPYNTVEQRCIIKGDGLYQSIAAAAIIAKTHRDELMINYHGQYPAYFLHKNKGYGSAQHVTAIEEYGYSNIHRKSFKLKKLNKKLLLFPN